jgi:hypothetical protein
VSTRLGERPPITEARGGSSDWTELIRLRRWREVRDLLKRLERNGIETRARRAAPPRRGRPRRLAPTYIVLVRRNDLDEARFVVVQLSFEGPSTDELPGPLSHISRWIGVALAGAILAVSLAGMTAGKTPTDGGSCGRPTPWARTICESSPGH